MKSKRNIIVTGGAGFIGSHLLRLFVNKYPSYHLINVDKLSYAGKLENVADLATAHNYSFEQADICDHDAMCDIMAKYKADAIIHLAAESHVDRSIAEPLEFAQTNIMGTLSLLQAAKECWKGCYEGKCFYHISTDEVYGSLNKGDAAFTEQSPYAPHSPYSASKASSDHLVRAFADTYGMPVLISHSSNNYGPMQHPEKLIPLVISKISKDETIPIYGTGENIRDWLYVGDHAAAIDCIFHHAKLGTSYNIGGDCEMSNKALISQLIQVTDEQLGHPSGQSKQLIAHVADRPGHDFRYAMDSSKLKTELGWQPSTPLENGLTQTVRWYLQHPSHL